MLSKVISWDAKTEMIEPSYPKEKEDIYISCISFEPRSTLIFEKLGSNYKAKFGFFIYLEEFRDFSPVVDNKRKLLKCNAERAIFDDVIEVYSYLENPIAIIMGLDEVLKKPNFTNKYAKITIDISTIPRGTLLTLLYYLRHHPKIDQIRVLYSTPVGYGDWLTQGYRSVMIPVFFEGPSNFGKKTALFILTGYEYDRVVSLIDDIEPSRLIIGRPFPSLADEFLEKSEQLLDRIQLFSDIETIIHEIPTNDPEKAKKKVNEVIEDLTNEYNVYLATLGPKLEVLGTYLSYEEKPNFRIVYPIPQIYNVGGYSVGIQRIYEYFL